MATPTLDGFGALGGLGGQSLNSVIAPSLHGNTDEGSGTIPSLPVTPGGFPARIQVDCTIADVCGQACMCLSSGPLGCSTATDRIGFLDCEDAESKTAC